MDQIDQARIEDEPLLLTPGPVTLSARVKRAMLHDYASGEAVMQETIAWSRRYLLDLCNAQGTHTAIPLVGSGTSGTEAAIGTFVPPNGKLLIHTNGVYGDRLVEIARRIRTPYTSFRTAPYTPPTAEQFAAAIAADPGITHVMVVHCETSTGILNPIESIAAVCRRAGKGLLIDAVASFGAFMLDAKALSFDAVICSANKGLQAPPGLAWIIAKKSALEEAKGNAHSLTLDLWDQNQHMDRTGMFRFTPATHLLLGFAEALREHAGEGGIAGRHDRYRRSWRRLVDGMRQMGFRTLLEDEVASPIVTTFHEPLDPAYSFKALYEGMKRRGFIIFPGRLAAANTFRIACIGVVTEDDIGRALDALEATMREMGVAGMGRI
ncbi:2-aminoethylphosphonate--pyruvate transaminase [Falsiroseomonas stagni]|uniref:2-aminoethylphosphonate--pyruvate transaminase n=1 Tax=Falsiroseomonas stagni DSM 19981 TaxID=1123062 RepID=A0A1I4DH83_9PROT|nr:2-aminoethylphosphonate--pyruvate transaminase [Falsiroseomonas stagni]SFK92862.1 2-aminoethylphosphonate-pyruvate transaminase [Falsiroseomonas stagni DSM 19981]